ncbi:MAG: helicase [Planctomycetes bacterium]|nr:helicase [Planctomycetota bacterium]
MFDIEQGVAIFVGSSKIKLDSRETYEYRDVVGLRDQKYKLLLSETAASVGNKSLSPKSPQYFFVPRDDAGQDEYDKWVSIVNAMPVNISGIVTAHDNLVVDFDDQRLIENAATLRNRALSDDDAREKLAVKDNAGWKLKSAREAMRRTNSDAPYLKPYAYRPFDVRRIYYHGDLVWCDRRNVMSHTIARDNVAIATCRQLARLPWEHVFVTRNLQDDCLISNRTRERSYHFPLFLHGDSRQRGMQTQLSFNDGGQQPNLSQAFLASLRAAIGGESASAEDAFHYVYAVLHSPAYRAKYAEFLKIDFPRIPLPRESELFHPIVRRGAELVALHLLESPRLEGPITVVKGSAKPQVEKPFYADGTVWLDKAQTCGFVGVPEDVWNFQIGGYQVCAKWLKDRKGRTLSKDDIAHYQKIVVALHETIRLMKEIDEVIEKHGGWPGAFVTTK